MEQPVPRRLRRPRTGQGDTADRPSDLRQALADLGRVIGQPFRTDAGPPPRADAEP